MHSLNYICTISIVVLFSLLSSCKHDDHAAQHENAAKEVVADDHNHSDEIILSHSMAERFGVKTAKLTPGMFNEVIKVSGQIVPAPDDQVVISAQSSGIVTFAHGITPGCRVNSGATIATLSSKGFSGGDTNEATAIALNAAKKELDRITPLYKEGIVSQKDYNAAEQAYEQARASHSGSKSGSVATAPVSGSITQLLVQQGEYVTAGQPIAVISRNSRLTLRADLPEKYYSLMPQINAANFRTTYNDTIVSLAKLNGKLISSSSANSVSQPGYVPVYFSFDNDGSVIPGAYAEVYLLGQSRDNVLTIPLDALTEHQGKYFVYTRLDEEGYQKHLVTVGSNDGQEVEILSGLHPGDDVVVAGAIAVKLAETSNVVPEGHSHNH